MVEGRHDTYRHYGADRIVAEGSEDVKVILHAADPTVNVELVTSTLWKLARAEPVASAYEKGWVHHAGTFRRLEARRCRGSRQSLSGPSRRARVRRLLAGSAGLRNRSGRLVTPSWLAPTPLEVSRASRRVPVA